MLIEKKDKDKRFIKNLRPISLINVDNKIASKVLAMRMQNILTSIISHDQTAYGKGRYIGESTRLISDVLDYTEDNSMGGIIFSADFEKAFDSDEHTFIFATLQSFGFGPQFIQWVRTIFRNTESCVMNNGHATGYFPLERRTRQGDPYLFILCLETLFLQIRENDNIKGIDIGDYQLKLPAFADDADFLMANIDSLQLVFRTCSTFQLYSSLELNLRPAGLEIKSLRPAGLETKWAPMKCQSTVSG